MSAPLTWVNGTTPALNDVNLNIVTQLAQDAHDIGVSAAAVAAAALAASGGGVSNNVVAKSVDYTAVNNDVVLVDATSGNRVITIPVTLNARVVVIRADGVLSHTVTVQCSGTINGDATATFVAQWASAAFVGTGSNVVITAAGSSGGGGGGSFSAVAGSVTYDNATSALPGSNVQDAIDELDARLGAAEATVAGHTSALAGKANLTDTPFVANINGTNTNLPAPSTTTSHNLTCTAATGKFTLPSGFSGAVSLLIRLNQDATGGRDYAIQNGSVTYGGDGVKPAMPTGAGTFMEFVADTLDGGTNWFIDKP